MATISGRTDIDVQTEIDVLAAQGWKPAQIHKHLSQQEKFNGRVPSQRTIERSVKRGTSIDKSGRWSLVDSTGDDARTVLNVLRGVIRRSDRRITYFTKDEADWVLKVSKAAPGLDSFCVWLLVKLYQRRLVDKNIDTGDLDAYIAFTPWEGAAQLAVYKDEVSRGLKPLPMWDWIVEPVMRWSEEDSSTSIRTLIFNPWPLEIDDPDNLGNP